MKTRILETAKQLRIAILHNPAEVILSVIFFILGSIYSFNHALPVEFILIYSPAFFLTTYTLNHLTLNKRIRLLYYLSILFFLPFLDIYKRYNSPVYPVTLIVFQLIYLVSKQNKDNHLFIQETLKYLKSLFSAALLAGIIWLVILSIYFSITYIFEIWENSTSEVISCITSFAFLLSFPLLFLMFNEKKQESEGYNRLFEVLLNYILSPALLIYAFILYLYFIKIAILWSLPKGGIAYIVVSFISAVFLLKGCQTFLRKQYYNWFYKYASFIVLPALIMYWTGTCYRINQYGFTELRVYLVIVGLILTCMAFFFFFKKWGQYYRVSILAIILLSFVTYIPGVKAPDIEHYSQANRKKNTTDNEKDESHQYSYYHIDSSKPINIENFRFLYHIYAYQNENAMWMEYNKQQDSIFLYSPNNDTIYKAKAQTLFDEQLQKAGIVIGDTIPESAYLQILQINLDSAVFVLENISVSRDTVNHPYKVNYLTPGYYLKK